MAEGEISILIKAIDDVSSTVKNIEKNLDGLTKSTERISQSTEKTSSSIQGQISQLIALGNIANQVDNIFSSYINLQLRLENAHLRVTNASERLEDAYTRLFRLQRDGKASSDDLADAYKEIDRAGRNLEISQNNLRRAQNQAIGTYINMGVQTLTLVNNLIILSKSMQTAAVATAFFKVVANPLVGILGLLAGAITLTALKSGEANKEIEGLTASLQNAIPATTGYNSSLSITISKYKEISENIVSINDAIEKMGETVKTYEREINTIFSLSGTEIRGAPKMDVPDLYIKPQPAQNVTNVSASGKQILGYTTLKSGQQSPITSHIVINLDGKQIANVVSKQQNQSAYNKGL